MATLQEGGTGDAHGEAAKAGRVQAPWDVRLRAKQQQFQGTSEFTKHSYVHYFISGSKQIYEAPQKKILFWHPFSGF